MLESPGNQLLGKTRSEETDPKKMIFLGDRSWCSGNWEKVRVQDTVSAPNSATAKELPWSSFKKG